MLSVLDEGKMNDFSWQNAFSWFHGKLLTDKPIKAFYRLILYIYIQNSQTHYQGPDALRVYSTTTTTTILLLFSRTLTKEDWEIELDYSPFFLPLGNVFTPHSILEKEGGAQRHFEVSRYENGILNNPSNGTRFWKRQNLILTQVNISGCTLDKLWGKGWWLVKEFTANIEKGIA